MRFDEGTIDEGAALDLEVLAHMLTSRLLNGDYESGAITNQMKSSGEKKGERRTLIMKIFPKKTFKIILRIDSFLKFTVFPPCCLLLCISFQQIKKELDRVW